MALWLAVANPYDPDLPGRVARYFSSSEFNSRGDSTPAHQFFDPRLIQPGSLERTLFSPGSTTGRSTLSLGEAVLNNVDGGLDDLIDHGWDGGALDLYRGPDDALVFPDDFTLMLSATMEQPEWDLETVVIRVRDRQFETSVPAQSELYAGNNALPDGLEGVAADLLGKRKPLVFGVVYNVSPPMVNTSRLIYQVSAANVAGSIVTVDAVYDNGVTLAAGAAYASQVDMETNAPAAAGYRVWTTAAGCYVRLGSSPAGTVTVDATEGATAADRTAAQVWRKAMLQSPTVTAGDVDAAAVAALDALNPAEVGLWVNSDETVAELADLAAGSVGAWWGQTVAGQFTLDRFDAPAGTPVATFEDPTSVERRVPSDHALPVWRVALSYQKNQTVQAGDNLAASVAVVRRGWLANEWRTEVATDATVQTVHPLAPALELQTALVDSVATAAEAARVQAMRGVHRDMLEVTTEMLTEFPTALLGEVVELVYDRFGMSAGKLFRVTGLSYDFGANEMTLTLWG